MMIARTCICKIIVVQPKHCCVLTTRHYVPLSSDQTDRHHHVIMLSWDSCRACSVFASAKRLLTVALPLLVAAYDSEECWLKSIVREPLGTGLGSDKGGHVVAKVRMKGREKVNEDSTFNPPPSSPGTI